MTRYNKLLANCRSNMWWLFVSSTTLIFSAGMVFRRRQYSKFTIIICYYNSYIFHFWTCLHDNQSHFRELSTHISCQKFSVGLLFIVNFRCWRVSLHSWLSIWCWNVVVQNGQVIWLWWIPIYIRIINDHILELVVQNAYNSSRTQVYDAI